MLDTELDLIFPTLKETRKASIDLAQLPTNTMNKGDQAKARFESLRAKVKKLSLTTFDHLKNQSENSELPLRIELMANSRVTDAGLTDFTYNLSEFKKRYNIAEIVGEVRVFANLGNYRINKEV